MKVFDAIHTRRSIRSFTKKRVPAELLKKILECGLRAPSSKNSNPWFFVVTRGKQKNQIADWLEEHSQKRDAVRGPMNAKTGKAAEGAFDSTAESIQTMREAAALILVFNRAPMSGGSMEVINNPRNGRSLYTYAGEIIGIGAAVQNILLAAHASGLGAVYMADSYPVRVAVQKALKTQEEMIGSIAIGYPAYHAPPRKIFRNLIRGWNWVKKNGVPHTNFTVKRF